MIRHTIVFKLKHPAGSQEEHNFLVAAKHLINLPTEKSFECLRQISPKSEVTSGLSMEFSNADDSRVYSEYSNHVDFVQTRWIPEVEKFMEIDYELLD